MRVSCGSAIWPRRICFSTFRSTIPLVTYYLGEWFNLLPFIVIGLMLVQTKLFAPPATTPEAEHAAEDDEDT